ncbi:MAG TPA: 30S ribosomal protein S1 [Conexibacter sp.]|nr:30S ribosomal protein S1 [Conexibacter sp.]
MPNYDATLTPFEEGEVVTGLVVRIDKDEVLVDIGYKSEGVIPANELSIRKSVDPHEEVQLGEEVDALVLTKEDQDGRLIMSKKRARFEKAWRRIEAAAESGEPVEGTVIEVVKGGLIIDLGVRGFLPASLVDIRRVPNLDEYLGTKIETKVIELNRSRNNVVLSRRAVLEEERKEVRQQILDRLQPGLVVEGQISNIVDFGAFVDLDGIDGLIHISELSWSHVNHPSEILGIGDTVQVKVLDIDRDRQRISLGLKQTQEDPWQRIVDTYNVNDELEGKVTKVVTFGAFVEILDGVEGLVHISELAPHHVENPREIVQPGDAIKVKILEIDSERRRLSLSAKRVEGQILPLNAATGELVDGQQTYAFGDDAPAAEAQPEAGQAAGEPAPGEIPAAEGIDAGAQAAEQPVESSAAEAPEAVESQAAAVETVEAPAVAGSAQVAEAAETAQPEAPEVAADAPEVAADAPEVAADAPEVAADAPEVAQAAEAAQVPEVPAAEAAVEAPAAAPDEGDEAGAASSEVEPTETEASADADADAGEAEVPEATAQVNGSGEPEAEPEADVEAEAEPVAEAPDAELQPAVDQPQD